MSYFDDASLVMIPSGYKDQKVYSVKPIDGSGDLTFSRATNATRVNSSGLVEKVRTNEILYSNDFSNGTWNKQVSGGTTPTLTSGQPDPFGGNNAWRLQCSITGGLYSMMSQALSTTGLNCNSIYIKSNTGSNQDVYFRIDNSDQTTIRTATTSWQRIEAFTSVAGQSFTIGVRSAATGATSSCDVLIYAAQTEAGDIATAPITTLGSAVSVGPVSGLPRLDYSGGASCPSLLLEPQTTALNQFSEQLDNAYWTQNGTTTTANQIVSPDGYTNADLVAATSAIGNRVERTGFSLSGSHTFSIFLKKGTSTRNLWYDGVKGVQIDWAADGTPTVTGFSAGVPASFGSVDYGNGWHRIWFQDTYSGTRSVQLFPDRTGGTGGVYAWGANLTATSYLQSYINTLSTAVTRVADVAYKTGISSIIGSTEGSVYFEGIINDSGLASAVFLEIVDGTDVNNAIVSYVDNSTGRAAVYIGPLANSAFLTAGNVKGQKVKLAFRWKTNDYAFYVNGSQVYTNTSLAAPSGMDALRVGNNRNGVDVGTTKVEQTLLFNTALTNAQLAELSTL